MVRELEDTVTTKKQYMFTRSLLKRVEYIVRSAPELLDVYEHFCFFDKIQKTSFGAFSLEADWTLSNQYKNSWNTFRETDESVYYHTHSFFHGKMTGLVSIIMEVLDLIYHAHIETNVETHAIAKIIAAFALDPQDWAGSKNRFDRCLTVDEALLVSDCLATMNEQQSSEDTHLFNSCSRVNTLNIPFFFTIHVYR